MSSFHTPYRAIKHREIRLFNSDIHSRTADGFYNLEWLLSEDTANGIMGRYHLMGFEKVDCPDKRFCRILFEQAEQRQSPSQCMKGDLLALMLV